MPDSNTQNPTPAISVATDPHDMLHYVERPADLVGVLGLQVQQDLNAGRLSEADVSHLKEVAQPFNDAFDGIYQTALADVVDATQPARDAIHDIEEQSQSDPVKFNDRSLADKADTTSQILDGVSGGVVVLDQFTIDLRQNSLDEAHVIIDARADMPNADPDLIAADRDTLDHLQRNLDFAKEAHSYMADNLPAMSEQVIDSYAHGVPIEEATQHAAENLPPAPVDMHTYDSVAHDA